MGAFVETASKFTSARMVGMVLSLFGAIVSVGSLMFGEADLVQVVTVTLGLGASIAGLAITFFEDDNARPEDSIDKWVCPGFSSFTKVIAVFDTSVAIFDEAICLNEYYG